MFAKTNLQKTLRIAKLAEEYALNEIIRGSTQIENNQLIGRKLNEDKGVNEDTSNQLEDNNHPEEDIYVDYFGHLYAGVGGKNVPGFGIRDYTRQLTEEFIEDSIVMDLEQNKKVIHYEV